MDIVCSRYIWNEWDKVKINDPLRWIFFSFVNPGNTLNIFFGFMVNVGKIVGLSKWRNKFMKYLLKKISQYTQIFHSFNY